MKKTFLLFGLALSAYSAPLDPPKLESPPPSKSYSYLTLSAFSPTPLEQIQAIPGISLGRRTMSDYSAFDFSIGYKHNQKVTFPKLNYLFYLSPKTSNNALYLGAGAALEGIKTGNIYYAGLIPNLVLGYEMNRKAAWHPFIQFDASAVIPKLALSYNANKFFSYDDDEAEEEIAHIKSIPLSEQVGLLTHFSSKYFAEVSLGIGF